MSFTLGFQDHEGFHRSALWMTVGGIVAGGVAGLAGAGIQGALFAGAAGAVLGAGWADRRSGGARLATRAALLAAAVGAFALVRGWAGGHAGVLALAMVLGLALNLGVAGWRALAAVAVGGAVAYLGGFAAGQVMVARETAPLPDALEVLLASTSMAVVSIAALLPRHVVVVRDAITAARASLPDALEPEVRDLLARGTAVWVQASPKLDDDARRLLQDGVVRLHDLAIRWSRVDRPTESRDVLEARGKELDGRIAAATDEVAREQYRAARGAVDDQLRYLASLEQSRDRVLARLHACVATLEKFRLAAAHLDGQQASRPLLTEVSADLDACSAAIAEVG